MKDYGVSQGKNGRTLTSRSIIEGALKYLAGGVSKE